MKQLFKFGSIWTEITAEIFTISRGFAILTGTNVAWTYDAWTNVLEKYGWGGKGGGLKLKSILTQSSSTGAETRLSKKNLFVYALEAVIMTPNPKFDMCPSWYDYIAIFEHFLVKKLFMKPYRDVAQITSIIQRKSWKIQRKISKVSILKF